MYVKHNEQLGKVFKNVGEGGADGDWLFRDRERVCGWVCLCLWVWE